MIKYEKNKGIIIEMSIYEELKRLNIEGKYPFHMPGHKRNFKDIFQGDNIFKLDITEITGYDDLNQPEGMIRKSMDYIKQVYGTKESYYLINSSTAGNLAAISALCNIGDKILVSRNCHKSVYNGVELLGLNPVYVYPKIDSKGICEGITVNQIQKIIEEEKDIKMVMIVSPTYEGRTSEISLISDYLHEKKIPLVVDEAHGAHFIYNEAFPDSAVSLGADIVIQSLHKTLPSLTQTGLLHLCSNCVSKEKMQKELSIFQSSSPSYILMSSIDHCVHKCCEDKKSFQQYVQNINILRRKLESLKHLSIVKTDDIGKIVISTINTNITGQQLFQKLREEYNLELEMAELYYVIAMTSVCDSKEGLERLYDALIEIDSDLQIKDNRIIRFSNIPNRKVMIPKEAGAKERKAVNFQEAEGKISADFIYLYPPGIPLVVPGEKISAGVIEKIKEYKTNHMKIVGCNKNQINIIYERI